MDFGIAPFLEKFVSFEINCLNFDKDCGIEMPKYLAILGAIGKVMIIINTL